MTEPSPRRFAPRVTVATIVEQDGRFLLVEEQVGGRLVLNQPAGHLDPGESLIEAARRETLGEMHWNAAFPFAMGQRFPFAQGVGRH